jgi:general nucleoside transport system permease protein
MHILASLRRLATALILPVAALLVSFLFAAFLITLVDVDPVEAFQAFLYGIAGNKVNIGNVLSVATPLMLCGLGIAFAAQCSVFNIGAEGQLYVGAIFAIATGLRFGDQPAYVLLPLILVAGFVGGGIWGFIPGILKAKYSVNEIVLTVMLTEIAIQLVSWVTRGPLLDPEGYGIPQTAMLSEAGQLPLIMKGTRLHTGLIVALVAAVVMYILLYKTTFGYRVRAVGFNAFASRYAGMGVISSISVSMLISGGLAGVAGAIEVAGVHYRLMDGISPGYGFTALVVSLLGKRHPFGVVISAILFSALQAGADAMQRKVAVPVHLALIIQAMTILLVIVFEYVNTYHLHLARDYIKRIFSGSNNGDVVVEVEN